MAMKTPQFIGPVRVLPGLRPGLCARPPPGHEAAVRDA